MAKENEKDIEHCIEMFECNSKVYAEMFKVCGYDLRTEIYNGKKNFVVYDSMGNRIGSVDFKPHSENNMYFSVQKEVAVNNDIEIGGEYQFQPDGSPWDMPASLKEDMMYYRVDVTESGRSLQLINKIYENVVSKKLSHVIHAVMKKGGEPQRDITIRPYGAEFSISMPTAPGRADISRRFVLNDIRKRPENIDRVTKYSEYSPEQSLESVISIDRSRGVGLARMSVERFGKKSSSALKVNKDVMERDIFSDSMYKLLREGSAIIRINQDDELAAPEFVLRELEPFELQLTEEQATVISHNLATTSRIRNLGNYVVEGFKDNFPAIPCYFMESFEEYQKVMEIIDTWPTDQMLEPFVFACAIPDCNLPDEYVTRTNTADDVSAGLSWAIKAPKSLGSSVYSSTVPAGSK